MGVEGELSLVDGEGEWKGFSLFIYPRVGFGSIKVCCFISHSSPQEFDVPCIKMFERVVEMPVVL